MRVSFRQGLYIYSFCDWLTCNFSPWFYCLHFHVWFFGRSYSFRASSSPSPFSSFLCYLRIFGSSQNLFQHFIWWFHSKLMVSGFFSMYELTDPSSMFSSDFLAISACYLGSVRHRGHKFGSYFFFFFHLCRAALVVEVPAEETTTSGK